MSQPNILFIMTDQQRFDTIASLGNQYIHTPNMNRLVSRGASYSRAYSTCPVCVAARYTIHTGCEPSTTRYFGNAVSKAAPGQGSTVEERCGPYLPKRMAELGYRTFGIGKFHTKPWDENLGYEVHLHSEEIYWTADQRNRDDYAAWIAREHPQFDYLEGLHGERSSMYYVPQLSPLPAELTVESWVADQALKEIAADDQRPYFGFISFIGPHPPFAPPIPFHRMYDPDNMPSPIKGEVNHDHTDGFIPWQNQLMWAECIDDSLARNLKARYYGEISYIDMCIGRILDAVEAREDTDNTMICFFSDHGDLLGDHHGWQKENFFDASCRIPFLLSWPDRILPNTQREDIVALTDLFGIATRAAGQAEMREGIDVLAALESEEPLRERLVGCHWEPGERYFKLMILEKRWKYIYMANGGREQLFDLDNDPDEMSNHATAEPDVLSKMRSEAIAYCQNTYLRDALDGKNLKAFSFETHKRGRIYQFDPSRNVTGFTLFANQ